MAKILIVDDERSIRETLAEFVKETGHEVFIAGEAEEALGVVARSVPDVVVCDIVLPGTDGIALLERVQRVASDTQVIMITGEPTVETASDAVRQGAFDYLATPVSRDEIQAVVESALRVKAIADERRRLAEENARYREHLEEEGIPGRPTRLRDRAAWHTRRVGQRLVKEILALEPGDPLGAYQQRDQ